MLSHSTLKLHSQTQRQTDTHTTDTICHIITQSTKNATHWTILRPFVRDHPGELVTEETFIHSHPSCSSRLWGCWSVAGAWTFFKCLVTHSTYRRYINTFIYLSIYLSTIFYQLPPSTTIHTIAPAQFICLTVFPHPISKSSGLTLGLEPSASYSTHFFTRLLSSFCTTCPQHQLKCQ